MNTLRGNRMMRTSLFILILFLTGASNAQLLKDSEKYSSFLFYMKHYYVDSVNSAKMVEDAIKYELKQLDPHSIYIPADEVQKMNEPLEGNFEGIGISFNILNDTLFVIAPIPGGPSERVGILAGDRILKVDGENIAGIGLTNEDVYRLLRGEKGTKVTVSVKRRLKRELIDFAIVRDKIPIYSLDASYMINENLGYIKLNRFAQTTMKEFLDAAIVLVDSGAVDLILDLTGNSGGYLEMAIALADQFLDNGKLIVYTEGINSPRNERYARSGNLFEKGRLIVLIDEGSASASEIVAGAVQDWDRGLLVGRRSFGKGLVQTKLRLPDDSEIRLTSARYYTPSGRLIQKPYNDGMEEYYQEIYHRYSNGELSNRDSINFPDSLKYSTLIQKRTVFGGGGIMPDIFVPLDTSDYSDYLSDLIRQGILNQFVLEYVDKNRKDLRETYNTFQDFRQDFVVDDKLLQKLVAYAREQDLPENETEFMTSQKRIAVLIKAYIARDLWTTSEFYEIANEDNEIFLKALEVMNNWDTYGIK
jgi:carboxyl-terminal processing protease